MAACRSATRIVATGSELLVNRSFGRQAFSLKGLTSPQFAAIIGTHRMLIPLVQGNRQFSSFVQSPATWSLKDTCVAVAAVLGVGAAIIGVNSEGAKCEAPKIVATQTTQIAETAPSSGDGAPDHEHQQWQTMIDNSVSAIVSVVFSTPRSFDTETPGSSQATGFVVDAERGIILTNKHVVHEGPINARVIFSNHEEVSVYPLYRDPVHDFGLLKFDPAKLKYIKPTELPLCPEKAKRGLEIRVIGNNAGEKLSILSGTLARLDRAAPNTGISADFNTFYIQAASGTSGGSSGSPVIDKEGNVVALNAAGRMLTSVSYYLPLDRVVRALEFVQKDELVPRGTIQTVWDRQPFGELIRLGLNEAEESLIRGLHPESSGMLTVKEVVPGGPASGHLQPGDILLRMNGSTVIDFTSLEDTMDNGVDKTVTLDIARGEERRSVEMKVQDLFSIAPSSFLEMGESVINNLSYHSARHYNIPIGGAYIAKAGYMFQWSGITAGCVITSVKGQKINDIADLAQALSQYADGEIVPIRVFNVNQPRVQATALVRIDRRWFPMQFATRDDKHGNWIYEQAPSPPQPSTTTTAPSTSETGKGTKILPCDGEAGEKIAPSLVTVRTACPYGTPDGGRFFRGTGLIVDAEKGFVICDRLTVPTALGDIEINISDSIRVAAKTVFIHPYHNIAVIQYDPKSVGDTKLKSCKFQQNSALKAKRGQDVSLVGMTGSRRKGVEIKSWKATVGYGFPASGQNVLTMNMDGITLSGIPSKQQDGVIVDSDGDVLGFFADFGTSRDAQRSHLNLGVPSDILQDVVKPLQEGRRPHCKCIGGRLDYIGLSHLRDLGLSDARANEIEERADKLGGRRQAVMLANRWRDTDAYNVLHDGDTVLSIDHIGVDTFRDIDLALQNKESVTLEIFRDGKIINVELKPFDATLGKSIPVDRMVVWAGCALREPPSMVKWISGLDLNGVYIASIAQGSPGRHHHLRAGCVIVELDGHPTPDLDSFLEIARQKGTGETVRIKTISMQGKSSVSTVELDKQYWPTSCISLEDDGHWQHEIVDQDVPTHTNDCVAKIWAQQE
eukprot:m.239242 g.239242  ORF g.239242 m.239242 type:complete len:1071 (+) comp33740_c0_seq3:194-3406(+)